MADKENNSPFKDNNNDDTNIIEPLSNNELDNEQSLPEFDNDENNAEFNGMDSNQNENSTVGEESTAKPAKKRRTGLIVGAAAIIVALGAGGGYYAYDSSQNTSVPEALAFINSDDDDNKVCEEFNKKELDCKIDWAADEHVERGALMKQSVASGEKIKKDSEVVLTYSNGPASSEFPNLRNVPLDEAKETLYKLGVNITEVNQVESDGLDKDNVVKASVPAGKRVNNGDSVSLSVSNGTVKLPDWKDKSKDYVKASAEKIGVKVKFVEEESDKTSGIVISQSPKAGETSNVKEVTVTISKSFEAKQVPVPNVINKAQDDAETELAKAGFRHIRTVKVKNNDVNETKVTQTVPLPGEKASTEDSIMIVVSEPIK